MHNLNIKAGSLQLTVLLLVAVGVLLAARQVVGQSPSPEEKLREKIEIYEAISKLQTMDPTAIAQKDAAQQAAIQISQERYAEWLEAFKRSGVDLRSLEWTELGGLYRAGPDGTDEAVRRAALIVTGRAVDIDFKSAGSLPQATVSFEVDRILLGKAEERLTVTFGGGPVPSSTKDDFSAAKISYFAVEPLLLPGDEAILIFEADDRVAGSMSLQAWTGVNKVAGGLILGNFEPGEDPRNVDQARLRSAFHDKSFNEVISLLESAVARR